MIEFGKLTAKNFLSIGNKEIEFLMDKGITVVKGKNGHGKSTLFEALYFIMTGDSYRGIRKGSLVNDLNKKGTEVTFEFKKGDNEYKIVRCIKSDDVKLSVNGDFEKEKFSDKKDFQVKIEEILDINTKILKQMVFLSQKLHKPFTTLDLKDKRTFISKVFGLDEFVGMEKDIKSDIKDLKIKAVEYDKDVERYREKMEYVTTVLEKRKNDLQERVTALKTAIKESEAQKESYKSKIKPVDEDFINESEEKIHELKTQINQMTQEIQKYNNCLYDMAYKDQVKQEMEEEKKDTEKDAKELKEYIDNENTELFFDKSTENDIERCKKRIREVETILAVNSAECNRIKIDLKFFDENDMCVKCGSDLSESHKKKNITELQEKYDKIIESTDDFKKDVQRNKELINKHEETINERQKSFNIFQSKNEEYEILIKKIDEMNENIEKNDHDIDKQDVHILIEKNKKSILLSETKIDDIKQKVSDEMNLEKEQQSIRTNIGFVDKTLKRDTDQLKTLKRELKDVDSQNEIDEVKTNLDLSDTKLRKCNLKLKYCRQIVNMIQDGGIKKYIVGQYLPMLNQFIEKYRHMLEFEHKIKLTEGGMNIEVLKRGKEKQNESFSGGEEQKINLAILFSFISLMRVKSGLDFPLLILDEITAPLDLDNTHLFYKILKQDFSEMYVMIINHRIEESDNQYVDRTVEVSKDIRGFSHYNIT